MSFQRIVCVSHSVVSDSLQPYGLQPTRLFCLWNSPGNNTRVDGHSLLQGIFLTQGSNPGLPPCRQILYCLSHQGRANSSLHQFINLVHCGCSMFCLERKQHFSLKTESRLTVSPSVPNVLNSSDSVKLLSPTEILGVQHCELQDCQEGELKTSIPKSLASWDFTTSEPGVLVGTS